MGAGHDVHRFFAQTGGQDVGMSIDAYFSQKLATDSEFRDYFPALSKAQTATSKGQLQDVEGQRLEFFRYYALKASVWFSKGSHDEWNIWQQLNQLRIKNSKFGIGTQIPGYFDGVQVGPGDAETPISSGYAVLHPPAAPHPSQLSSPSASTMRFAPVTSQVLDL